MEPRIQYAKTKDGVSIPFYTLGEGMPLVYMPPPFSFIEREWQIPGYLRWYERLAEKWKLIRYDNREAGLSKGDVADYSLDGWLLDLEAVVEHLRLDRFALYASVWACVVAVAYSARNDERVSHLILCHAFARGSDFTSTPRVQGLAALIEKDWELYTETIAHVALGWSAGEPARRGAAMLREIVTPEALPAALQAVSEFDATALLPEVRSPTLVLHRRDAIVPVYLAKGLASRIPDARLVLLEGDSIAPYIGDTEAMYQAIDEFLSEGEDAATGAAPSGLVTILFTDVEGSTALTQRLGDAKARDLLRQHERIVREALQSHGGSELKTTGDGFMASFSSATRALESAIDMQRAFAAHNESAEEPILVRVGMNAGEPIAEEADLYGTAVNLAARICGHAEAGQILASDVVRQLVAGKDFLFTDRGETNLKGFDEPVRLYEVRWRE